VRMRAPSATTIHPHAALSQRETMFCLRNAARLATRTAAGGHPNLEIDRVADPPHGAITNGQIHASNVIAAGSVMPTVQAGGAVAVPSFEVGRQRVVIKSGPNHTAPVILVASVPGGGGIAVLALSRPLLVHIRRAIPRAKRNFRGDEEILSTARCGIGTPHALGKQRRVANAVHDIRQPNRRVAEEDAGGLKPWRTVCVGEIG